MKKNHFCMSLMALFCSYYPLQIIALGDEFNTIRILRGTREEFIVETAEGLNNLKATLKVQTCSGRHHFSWLRPITDSLP